MWEEGVTLLLTLGMTYWLHKHMQITLRGRPLSLSDHISVNTRIVQKAEEKKNKSETEDEEEEIVDVLIIGAGFGGAWLCDRIKHCFPHLTIKVVEGSSQIGGRLRSDNNDGPNTLIKDELGGMRIFPHVMPELAALVKRFNLCLEPTNLDDSNNLFYYKGKVVKRSEAKMPDGGRWAGTHPSEMSTAAVTAYKQTSAWENCNHIPYECPELRYLNVSDFFKRYANATEEEIACNIAFSGYNIYHRDVQSSLLVHDGDLYGSKIKQHHFIHEGFCALVVELFKSSGIAPQLNTTVREIQKTNEHFLTAITVTTDNNNNNKSQKRKKIRAKKIMISISALDLEKIEGLVSILAKDRMKAISSSKHVPLFKCFLDFNEPWWEKFGFAYGRTTTDGPCRQMFYYDKEDILVYCSDGDILQQKFASYWDQKFTTPHPRKALEEMFEEVKNLHIEYGVPAKEIPEPNWDDCVFAYWPSGSHKWKIGAEVRQCIDIITDGTRDNSSVYVAGDAFSELQGWVQGCLKTSELAFQKAFPVAAFLCTIDLGFLSEKFTNAGFFTLEDLYFARDEDFNRLELQITHRARIREALHAKLHESEETSDIIPSQTPIPPKISGSHPSNSQIR